jgi:hypothetical protein
VSPPYSVDPSLYRRSAVALPLCSFPVLLDVERPLELQVSVVVIIDELGNGLVVATTEHTRRGGFGLDYKGRQRSRRSGKGCLRTLLLIEWLLLGAGTV